MSSPRSSAIALAASFAAILTLLARFAASQCSETGNEILDSTRQALCAAYSVKSSMNYDAFLCKSTVCYTVTPGAGAAPYLSWNVLGGSLSASSSASAGQSAPNGANSPLLGLGSTPEDDNYAKPVFDASLCPSSDVGGSFVPSQRYSNIFANMFLLKNAPSEAGSTSESTQCSVVNGMVTMGTGELWLSLENTNCVFEIPVVIKSAPCPAKDCQLDTSKPDLYCDRCSASCEPADSSKVVDQTCTFPVLQQAANGGAPCPDKTVTQCTTQCTRDCVMTLEPEPECTANIIQRTVTMTRFWKTAITPQFRGKVCDPALSFSTYTCSRNFYKPCVLDYNKASCDGCRAQCNGFDGEVTSVRRCSYPTLDPGEVGGAACPVATFDLPCVQICAVNCEMRLEPDIPCSSNCMKPTETFVRKWTTYASPKNGGTLCQKNLAPVTKVCSMGSREIFLKCGGQCIVDGNLEDPCYKRCKAGESPPFVATATYPITLRPNLPGFPPCPTSTTTCQCTDCVLHPVPTSLSDCEANCLVGDIYAIGSQTAYYSKLQAGVGAADLSCNTRSIRLCQKQCTCGFTSQIAESCTFTKTLSSEPIWTAVGDQKITLLGEDPNCMQISTVSCQSIVKKQNCVVSARCPTCSCNQVAGPKYTISTSQRCALSTIIQQFAGGRECPAQLPVSLCYKECPGCNYPMSYCTCSFTEVAENTIFMGNPVCTYAPENQNDPLGNALKNQQCPESTKTKFIESCTSYVQPEKCAYETKTCKRCIRTSSFLDSGNYYGAGYRECIMTDLRNIAAPVSCSLEKQTTAKCTYSLSPVDCKAVDYCAVCKIENLAGVEKASEYPVSCSRKVLVSAAFGGAQCPPIPQATKICIKPAVPQLPSSVFSLPFINLYNAIILSNVDTSSSIDGGLLVCGNAALNGVGLGNALLRSSEICGSIYPSLFVAGDLLMTGTVNAGNVLVNGKCSTDGVTAKCGLTCLGNAIASEKTCESSKVFDCSTLKEIVQQQSINIFKLQATTSAAFNEFGLLDITWAGTNREVLLLKNTNTDGKPLVIALNRMLGIIKPASTIIINVDSAQVIISGTSMAFLLQYSEYILWNFPNTISLRISGVQVMGSIIAPKATVNGNGIINGILIANSITGAQKNSLSLVHNPFKGEL